ncbi:hypothetical protein OCA5_pHCG300070 (plasmid) [Afipia carboxidovorans OM5]|uniref:Uncharacterized protein n=1 Tax=Afipia carboxidovorans (strain ATCC 49405 / DSM 1227 / KCTC 32145 / OM5) TaxID=504832 RepID=F8C0X2_AFIC5|nr:hypothetical protein [Afipia carboxidovorans]AEI04454.1 hypothetical protein OCA4_pHCG3B00070 [Afipia carboxidovorans OM4]AEI08082.1 hypothetical protein OCA5_pHCG300070 [Afipia carboxidovorans OM5]
MVIEYKGYRIATWIDDDTNHAPMLKGKKGPERLYVDIDPINDGDGRQPASKRFSADIVKKHQFSGTEVEQLVQVAKLWVDEPEQFIVQPSPIARAFRPR